MRCISEKGTTGLQVEKLVGGKSASQLPEHVGVGKNIKRRNSIAYGFIVYKKVINQN
jgi:hypothetical protein